MIVAGFPMYDWPECQSETDEFWQYLKDGLSRTISHLPHSLSRDKSPYDLWLDDNLIVAQTCGWPLVSRLQSHVELIGTPDYQLDNAQAGYYYSYLIVRKNAHLSGADVNDIKKKYQDRELTLAVNSTDSQSGCRAYIDILGQVPDKASIGNNIHITASHRNSLKAVAEGVCDIAVIDAVTYRLAMQFEPACEKVKIIGHTSPKPGLPLICAPKFKPLLPELRSIIAMACHAGRLSFLGINGMVDISLEEYIDHLEPNPI